MPRVCWSSHELSQLPQLTSCRIGSGQGTPLQDVTSPHSVFQLKHASPSFLYQPRAVTVTGLGTFHIKKWLSFENGQVFTFRRPVFSLSKTLGQIRNLKHRCVRVPGKNTN